MKTLTLSLKKQWFDMIKAGIKKEEYREIKPRYLEMFCTTLGVEYGERGIGELGGPTLCWLEHQHKSHHFRCI